MTGICNRYVLCIWTGYSVSTGEPMEAVLTDLTERINRIEYQMRELMQGMVFLYERLNRERDTPDS
jgi:hypothetical protein